MTEESIFNKEEETLHDGMELLLSQAVPCDQWPGRFETLLESYARLLRQTQRVVRIGDTMQNQLNVLNEQLDQQRTIAEQANRAKSSFIAMVSHDIRTPMAAILGMAELLTYTTPSPEQIEYIDDIRSSGEALLTLVDDLLDLSKIEAGRLEYTASSFDLRDCLEEALRATAIRAHAKGLELACAIPRTVPFRIVGDPGRLRQILLNLLNNAVKFTERGEIITRVHPGPSDRGDLVLNFSVSDSGMGIPTNRLESIFLEYEQVEDHIVQSYGGYGLGLAICSKLVEMMRGRIWAESVPGRGSVFHFTAHFQIDRSDEFDKAWEFSELSGRRILVVDDNHVSRGMIHDFLADWDMAPFSLPSGIAGIEAMKNAYSLGKPFDVVLIDSLMPEMDGAEMVDRIRRDPGLADSKLVLLTTRVNDPRVTECLRGGAVSCVVKPLRQRELLQTLRQAVTKESIPCVARPLQTLSPTPTPATALRVLVAEDNPVNRKLVVRVLEKMGQHVCAAQNGREVLGFLEKNLVDVILMDVDMPVMDGLEATRLIRKHEQGEGKHTPIIAMTAHAMPSDRERFLAAGMDGYVSKPVQWRQLIDTIDGILAGARRK